MARDSYTPSLFDMISDDDDNSIFLTGTPAPKAPEAPVGEDVKVQEPAAEAMPAPEKKPAPPVIHYEEPEEAMEPQEVIPEVKAPKQTGKPEAPEKPARQTRKKVQAEASESVDEDDLVKMVEESAPRKVLYEEAPQPKVQYRTPVTGSLTSDVKEDRQQAEDVPLRRRPEEPEERDPAFSYTYESLSKPKANYKTFDQMFVSVHSPKGGVGKSTLSKELAWAMSLGEVNGQKLKVLLFDADFENGDQAMLFNLEPSPNMKDWVKVMQKDLKATGRIPRYDKTVIKRFVLPVTENLDLLAGVPSQMDSKLITLDMVKAMLSTLRSSDYDVVIFDNANTIKDERNFAILSACDKYFLVDTLDMTTINEIANSLNDLRNLSFDLSKISLVLNNIPEDPKYHDITPESIVDAFELKYCTSIPKRDQIRMVNNAAEAEIWSKKDNDFTKAIKKMANEILPVYPEKKKGFLGKLFSK